MSNPELRRDPEERKDRIGATRTEPLETEGALGLRKLTGGRERPVGRLSSSEFGPCKDLGRISSRWLRAHSLVADSFSVDDGGASCAVAESVVRSRFVSAIVVGPGAVSTSLELKDEVDCPCRGPAFPVEPATSVGVVADLVASNDALARDRPTRLESSGNEGGREAIAVVLDVDDGLDAEGSDGLGPRSAMVLLGGCDSEISLVLQIPIWCKESCESCRCRRCCCCCC